MHTATARAATLSITALSLEAVRDLLEPCPAPCLSVYLPTHRNVPDNRVDRPSFRQLVSALEMSLSAAHRREEIDRLLRPFRLLTDDQRFWEHTRDGLAVLASDGVARVFVLQRPVQPLALVTSRFHLLPLLRIAAAHERFQLLALTSREARVFEGTSWHGAAGRHDARPTVDRLDPVPLPAGAGSVATEGRLVRDDVVDEEILQPHRVKLGKGPAGMAAGAVVHGGFGSKQDEVDKDTEIFLRHVDEVVLREVSQPSGLPLVLVAAIRPTSPARRSRAGWPRCSSTRRTISMAAWRRPCSPRGARSWRSSATRCRPTPPWPRSIATDRSATTPPSPSDTPAAASR